MRTVLAAARYEFRMQITRRTTWITSLLLAVLLLAGSIPHWDPANTFAADIGIYAMLFNILPPVVFGALLADRAVRDGRLGVEELLDSLPTPPTARLWGKYLGTAAACLLPLLVTWCLALVRAGASRHDWHALPLGLGAFAAIEVPALLFVAAFALACPTVLGAPLFRVLLVGYWFWGNLVTAQVMPTPSGTWLAPLGDHARLAFFGGGPFADPHSYAGAAQSVAAGLGSIAVQLTAAGAALVALTAHQARRRAAR